MKTFKFKYQYAPLFNTRGRYYDLWGGRGRGGSYTGTDLFLKLITGKDYFRGCFLRNTFNDIRSSLFQDFKDRIEENPTIEREDFDINENEMKIIYRPTGNMIISKGVTKTTGRTAKLKSIAGVTHVLIEEADEIGEYDFDQLDLSLRTIKVKDVQIIRIFNPPGSAHWIWKSYILTDCPDEMYRGKKPNDNASYFFATPKSDSGIVAIHSTYHDNLRFLSNTYKAKMEGYRESNPEFYYTMILGLISEGERGRIFKNWKSITNDFFNNVDAKSIFGLDFGLASPAGLPEIKFVKNTIYIRQLNYKPLTNKEIALLMCKLGIKQSVVIADSAEPDSISKIRRGWKLEELEDVIGSITEDNGNVKAIYRELVSGFNIYPADKPKGSVTAGISLLKDMIVYVTEDSAELWNEYKNYKWALDKNKNPTNEPIDEYNHLIDPIRYVCRARAKHY